MVSRRWRDIILNSPSFWARIHLTPEWSASLIRTHIIRSLLCPIDIVIRNWDSRRHATLFAAFMQQLDIVLLHVSRWRSLNIQRDTGTIYASSVAERINGMVFPLLSRVSINLSHNVILNDAFLLFLKPESVPRLTSLSLGRLLIPSNNFRVPPTVTELTLSIDPNLEGPPFLYDPSLRGLKSLALHSWAGFGSLRIASSGIHLPLLEYLACDVSDAEGFLRALSAPKLIHFIYWGGRQLPSTVFSGLQFSSVHRFTVILGRNRSEDPGGMVSLCLAVPAVRDVELKEEDLEAFFGVAGIPCAADVWEHLEGLFIEGWCCDLLDIEASLGAWLRRRQQEGKPRIKIRFDFLEDTNQLQDLCEDHSPGAFCATMGAYCDLVVPECMPWLTSATP
ncbi:hypothetical protein ID866_7843 [Astraeus odoratus]|nr:hypothetical protein ID866_7843 [Astraeus odoratus]